MSTRSNLPRSTNDAKTGFLKIIMGPMYSGKTTELKRLIRIAEQKNQDILVVRHAEDYRIIDNNDPDHAIQFLTTHDGDSIRISQDGSPRRSCIATNLLSSIEVEPGQLVAIEEGQFFSDLKQTVLSWIFKRKVDVIVVALSSYASESQTEHLSPLPQVLELIPHANNIVFFSTVCTFCRSDEGLYHFHRDKSTPYGMCVGGKEKYGVACRDCIVSQVTN